MVKDIQNPDEERAPLNPNDGDTDNIIHPVEMDLGMILERSKLCCFLLKIIDCMCLIDAVES